MLVRGLMMPSMDTGPSRWPPLQSSGAHPRQDSAQPPVAFETSVGKQAVIPNSNRESGKEIETPEQDKIDGAGPEPEAEQSAQVQAYHQKALNPV
jgi:hypothetical protein